MHPTLERLEDQINWYDKKSRRNQRFYKWLKAVTVIAAAMVPAVSVGVGGRPYAAALGVIIVVAEGLQQMNQYQANWISYRSTCEALKHDKYLFLAKAGPYASASDPIVLLAERIEGLVSQEHAKWASTRQDSEAKNRGGQTP